MDAHHDANLIADILDNNRNLTKFFIKQLNTEQLEERYVVNGAELNSAYWVIAHIVWAEYYLTLRQLGGPRLDLPWIKAFGIGADGTLPTDRPDFKGLWQALNDVHAVSQQFVRSLTNEALNEPVEGGETPLWKTKRDVLYHAIRHEGQHVGHLSWICRFQGKKVI